MITICDLDVFMENNSKIFDHSSLIDTLGERNLAEELGVHINSVRMMKQRNRISTDYLIEVADLAEKIGLEFISLRTLLRWRPKRKQRK